MKIGVKTSYGRTHPKAQGGPEGYGYGGEPGLESGAVIGWTVGCDNDLG